MNKIVKKDGSVMSDEEIFDEVVKFSKRLYPNCRNIADSLGKTLYQGGKSFVLTKKTFVDMYLRGEGMCDGNNDGVFEIVSVEEIINDLPEDEKAEYCNADGSIKELTTRDIEGLTGGKLPIRCKKCGCWSHL